MRTRLRRLTILISLGLVLYVVGSAYRKSGVVVRHEIMEVGGLRREYRLVIPRSLTPRLKHPLVVAFHGALDLTDEMAAYTELDTLAADKKFLLVYPQGRHLNWPPFIPPENPELMQPDIDFFDSLCDQMVNLHGADPRRIYVLGVSQGGAMSTVITAFRSDRIAATICNCGWLPRPLAAPLLTTYKSPLLFIVGADDTQVLPSATRTAHDAFAASGHPCEFLVIPHHGHGWPRERGINDIAWQFFSQQSQPVSPNP